MCSDEIALKAGQDEDCATTSNGSTHTSDYTWTERTDDRSSGEDSVSSGGSANSAKYTEEGDVLRMGPMLCRNVPTLHALGASEEEVAVDGNDRKRQRNWSKLTYSVKRLWGN